MTDRLHALLGGYATGTLTESERKILFEAALEDQELFEALSSEEALRELLSDSAVRGELLQAVSTPKFSIRDVFAEWLERPRSKVLLGTGVVLGLAVAVSVIRQEPVRQIAQVAPPVLESDLGSAEPPAVPSEAAPIVRREARVKKKASPAAELASAPAPARAASVKADEEAKVSAPEAVASVTAGDVTLQYRFSSGAATPGSITLLLTANERGMVVFGASQTMVKPGVEISLLVPIQDPVLRMSFQRIDARPLSTLLPRSNSTPAALPFEIPLPARNR